MPLPLRLTFLSMLAFCCAGAWRAGGAEVVPVWTADLKAHARDAIPASDKHASGGHCIVADISPLKGTMFQAETSFLKAGIYKAVIGLKLRAINHINTAPLHWRLAVSGAGSGSREFDVLLIERAGVYQPIECPFEVASAGKAVVSLSWERRAMTRFGKADMKIEAKDIPKAPALDKIGADSGPDDALDSGLEALMAEAASIDTLKYLYMAVDRVSVVRVSDAAVREFAVDKIRYNPGERPRVLVAVRNYAEVQREFRLETEFVNDLDHVVPADSRTMAMGPDRLDRFEFDGPPLDRKWGWAARARLYEKDRLLDERSAFFTVHSNLWAVMIAGRAPAQFTAHVDRDSAVKAAALNKSRHRNWVESGFWAPDEFGDFTPATEKWWGGQGCYYGSVSGTVAMIEEGHKIGISFALYSNIWGGDGPPAFENTRRHPEWSYASTFNVEWLERWDRNTMGRGIEGYPMHVWPITIIHHSPPYDAALHHARELIAAHRTLGWDAVRYDSHSICDDNARVMDVVKKAVLAELPGFQFGYNSSVPGRKPELAAAFKAQCDGEGLIMEEGIRQFGGGGMSFQGGATYEQFARRLLDFSREARESGGHFCAIGMDECFPNDLVYQYIIWLAGNAHPCYDWKDVSVADYMAFATRFAGLLWDPAVKPVARPADIFEPAEAESFLWLWKDFIHERDLGGGRRQLILHLVNAPAEKALFTNADCKVPDPRINFPLAVRLTEGARVARVWFLTAEPDIAVEPIEFKAEPGRIRFVVPRLRFWSMVVVEMEQAGP